LQNRRRRFRLCIYVAVAGLLQIFLRFEAGKGIDPIVPLLWLKVPVELHCQLNAAMSHPLGHVGYRRSIA